MISPAKLKIQIEAALKDAEYHLHCLGGYGPTSYQLWHFHAGIDPMHELHAYFLKSKRTTPQNEPFVSISLSNKSVKGLSRIAKMKNKLLF